MGMKITSLLIHEIYLHWSQQELEEDCVNCEIQGCIVNACQK